MYFNNSCGCALNPASPCGLHHLNLRFDVDPNPVCVLIWFFFYTHACSCTANDFILVGVGGIKSTPRPPFITQPNRSDIWIEEILSRFQRSWSISKTANFLQSLQEHLRPFFTIFQSMFIKLNLCLSLPNNGLPPSHHQLTQSTVTFLLN